MLTALTDVEQKVRGIDAGADDFLSKPVNNAELQSRIRSLLRAKFYRQQLVRKNALLERILTRWQSPEVVQPVLDDTARLRLGGVRNRVSVLFADLSGFTPFAESRAPEAVMETLNQTFARLTELVFKHHGTLDKFIGDCVMAFYGAPIPAGNDALNAVRSALEMRAVFNELKTQWGDDERATLGLAIGINTGEAIVGNVGSDRRMEYTVIGEHRERGRPASGQGGGRPDPHRGGHVRADPRRDRRPARASRAEGHGAQGAREVGRGPRGRPDHDVRLMSGGPRMGPPRPPDARAAPAEP